MSGRGRVRGSSLKTRGTRLEWGTDNHPIRKREERVWAGRLPGPEPAYPADPPAPFPGSAHASLPGPAHNPFPGPADDPFPGPAHASLSGPAHDPFPGPGRRPSPGYLPAGGSWPGPEPFAGPLVGGGTPEVPDPLPQAQQRDLRPWWGRDLDFS